MIKQEHLENLGVSANAEGGGQSPPKTFLRNKTIRVMQPVIQNMDRKTTDYNSTQGWELHR
jgi:hypothetical protein